MNILAFFVLLFFTLQFRLINGYALIRFVSVLHVDLDSVLRFIEPVILAEPPNSSGRYATMLMNCSAGHGWAFDPCNWA